MFIYNVTTQMTWAIHEAWVQWMIKQHIPDVLATGCFVKHQLVRLLDTDETEGPTYAVQYSSLTKDNYTKFIELHATRLREESFNRWGNNFMSFRSLMEVVN